MDWPSIESFLKNSVWGHITIAFVSNAIFWIVLNYAGRTNRKIKYLWAFYNSGRKQLILEIANSDTKMSMFKFMTMVSGFICIFLFILVPVALKSGQQGVSKIISITMLFGNLAVFTLTWLIVVFAYRKRIQLERINKSK